MSTENRPYVFELASQIVEQVKRGQDDTATRDAAARNGVDAGELDRAVAIVEHFAAGGADIQQWLHQEYVIDGWLRGYLSLDSSASDVSTWTLGQLAENHYAGRNVVAATPADSPDGQPEPVSAISQLEARIRAIGGRIQDALHGPEEQKHTLLQAAGRALADTDTELWEISNHALGDYGQKVADQIDEQQAIIANHLRSVAGQ